MLRNVGLFKTIAPILRRSDSPIFLIDVQMLVCFCALARTFTSLPQYISAGAHAPQLTIPFWTAQIFTLDRFTILLLLGYITRRTSLCCCCSKVLIRIIGKLLVPLSWVLSLFLLQRIVDGICIVADVLLSLCFLLQRNGEEYTANWTRHPIKRVDEFLLMCQTKCSMPNSAVLNVWTVKYFSQLAA